ncbi:hypothetical protein BDW72DRAFT_187480 [Aspergillus terricola var. indicus]
MPTATSPERETGSSRCSHLVGGWKVHSARSELLSRCRRYRTGYSRMTPAEAARSPSLCCSSWYPASIVYSLCFRYCLRLRQ